MQIKEKKRESSLRYLIHESSLSYDHRVLSFVLLFVACHFIYKCNSCWVYETTFYLGLYMKRPIYFYLWNKRLQYTRRNSTKPVNVRKVYMKRRENVHTVLRWIHFLFFFYSILSCTFVFGTIVAYTWWWYAINIKNRHFVVPLYLLFTIHYYFNAFLSTTRTTNGRYYHKSSCEPCQERIVGSIFVSWLVASLLFLGGKRF